MLVNNPLHKQNNHQKTYTLCHCQHGSKSSVKQIQFKINNILSARWLHCSFITFCAGDFRMVFGEDRSKVSNIVRDNMQHFKTLYSNILHDCPLVVYKSQQAKLEVRHSEDTSRTMYTRNTQVLQYTTALLLLLLLLGYCKITFYTHVIQQSLFCCSPAGGQKSRRPVCPTDDSATYSAAKHYQAGRPPRQEQRCGGDPAAGGSGPRLWRCRAAR